SAPGRWVPRARRATQLWQRRSAGRGRTAWLRGAGCGQPVGGGGGLLVGAGQFGAAAVALVGQGGDGLREGEAGGDDGEGHAERGAEDELEYRDGVVPALGGGVRVVGRALGAHDHRRTPGQRLG